MGKGKLSNLKASDLGQESWKRERNVNDQIPVPNSIDREISM